MPIRPFLAGRPFDPEIIESMSTALRSVCAELGLAPVDDPVTRTVARKIIELAERGVRESAQLHAMTLDELK